MTHVGLQSLCQVLGVTRITDKAQTEGKRTYSENEHVRCCFLIFMDVL